MILHICRLSILRNMKFVNYARTPHIITSVQYINMKPTPYKPPKVEDYDEQNVRRNRPTSPYLFIYKVQLTSFLSIWHRITGIMLGGYLYLISSAALFAPEPLSCYIEALDEMDIDLVPMLIVKSAIALPFCYHFWNGIRHLFWDLGFFLQLRGVYITGYMMVLFTCLSTFLLANY